MKVSEIIIQLEQKKDLSFEQTKSVFTEIFLGNLSDTEIKKNLVLLHQKGENYQEIAAAADVMRSFSLRVNTKKDVFDVCGTGGSKSAKTFNLSTTVSILLSAAGVPVAKHGNRAASSKSGSADVLEELGIDITINPSEMEKNIEEKDLAFLFAQVLHPAMKHIMPVRKSLSHPTIFNFLGPLTSPANPYRQLVGVSSKKMILPMIKALKKLGKKSAMVVYGEDGLDEITLTGKTFYAFFSEDEPTITQGVVDPTELGFSLVEHAEIAGGTPSVNARIVEDIFSGIDNGPKKDILVLNAGIAFFVYGKTHSISSGIALATEIIDSGKAMIQLDRIR